VLDAGRYSGTVSVESRFQLFPATPESEVPEKLVFLLIMFLYRMYGNLKAKSRNPPELTIMNHEEQYRYLIVRYGMK
jgi:hypothetical protein